MKVAIISRGTPNEKYPLYGIFEFDQAKALARKGVEVAFVAIDFRSHSFKRKYGMRQYVKNGVQVFELSLPINVYRKAIPVLQRLLLIPFKAMLKSFGKPDAVHAHFYSIAAIASVLKKKYGIPLVVTEHSSKLNKPTTEISDLDQRLAIKAYQDCDQLICVSEALRANILQNFHHDSIVIPNMVDNSVFQCRETPLDDSPFIYVSVGNLIPIKAFDRLIEAFAQVKGLSEKPCLCPAIPERNLWCKLHRGHVCRTARHRHTMRWTGIVCKREQWLVGVGQRRCRIGRCHEKHT